MIGDTMHRYRHSWLIGPIDLATRLAVSLDPTRMMTFWAPGTWKPERVFEVIEHSFGITCLLQAASVVDVRIVEAQIEAAPHRLIDNTGVRMVLATPHAPAIGHSLLQRADVAVFDLRAAMCLTALQPAETARGAA